jgi:hypothetical protein
VISTGCEAVTTAGVAAAVAEGFGAGVGGGAEAAGVADTAGGFGLALSDGSRGGDAGGSFTSAGPATGPAGASNGGGAVSAAARAPAMQVMAIKTPAHHLVLRWSLVPTAGRSDGVAMHPLDTATPPKPQPFCFFGRCRVRDLVRRVALWSIGLVAAVSACGRTELDPFGLQPIVVRDAAVLVDHPLDAPADLPSDQPRDLLPDRVDARADVAIERGPTCVPDPEICNGKDDDCDGMVDESQPPIVCPNGGERYCVAGTYSECPRRCDVCNPGSTRTCFTSFCTFWGSQSCATDGRSWSSCAEERTVPDECKQVAQKMMRSPELEMCCLKAGHCCVDAFDLDNDGDRSEQLGRCDAVTCDP